MICNVVVRMHMFEGVAQYLCKWGGGGGLAETLCVPMCVSK